MSQRIKVTVLCTEERHPINPYLREWASSRKAEIDFEFARHPDALRGGDFLFLLSCHDVIDRSKRECYGHALVVHASALPRGRGWSPHVWQILEGATQATVSLLDAADRVDAGDLWAQIDVGMPAHAVWHEINDLVFGAVLQLLDFAIKTGNSVVREPQRSDIEPTYYPRRVPEDSKLDPNKSIAEQFDLMRVSDPERYPAYFELHGHRYIVRLDKKECQNGSS